MGFSSGLFIVALLSLAGVALGQTTTAPSSYEVSARVEGELVRVEGKNLVVRLHATVNNIYVVPRVLEDAERVVVTDERTVIRLDAEPAKLEELEPGMRLALARYLNGGARALTIIAQSKSRGGIFIRADGRDIVLDKVNGVGPVTIVTDEKTKVIFLEQIVDGKRVAGGERKFADLETGMILEVIPETGTAKKIIAHRPRPMPVRLAPPPPPPVRAPVPAGAGDDTQVPVGQAQP